MKRFKDVMSNYKNKKTHFGFQEIPWEEKQEKVSDVFHSVASRYDLMNDLMSFGIHRLWKNIAVTLSSIRENATVLDLAGGTGDLAMKYSKLVGPNGKVILSDINESMIAVGRDRIIDQGMINNISFVQANAEYLPFADNSFDCVNISFGLRNVTNKNEALKSMRRVLKKGGKLLILEFSKVHRPILKKIYDSYSFNILPKLGKFITNDEDSYRYLAESIKMHPDQQTLVKMMQNAGFKDASYKNMSSGIVALHQGTKNI